MILILGPSSVDNIETKSPSDPSSEKSSSLSSTNHPLVGISQVVDPG